MLLKHYFTPKIAHSSYILGASETCAVIDPRRDVQLYVDEARVLGLRITHIIETHLHADFVSGHLDLAERTGAAIYCPADANCAFGHVGLVEGDRIDLEHLRLDVLKTPGHTPEHLSYVVTDTSRSESPVGVFCGDTMFVGDVGRPDLFPGVARELASELYDSLHGKLLTLPDHVEIYPAHGAGSLCGRSMAAKWTSTVGYERRHNPALQIADREAFIDSLTSDMPPAPDHFRRCSDVNRDGPTLWQHLSEPARLDPLTLWRRLVENSSTLLDVRGYAAFSAQHIAGSLHIGLAGNFPTFAGWLLPAEQELLLIADNHDDVEEATTWARRVGVDRVVAALEGGMSDWASAGLPTDQFPLVSVEDLHTRVLGEEPFVLLDVRASNEFDDSHIAGAINVPAPDLRTRHGELSREQSLTVVCSTGNRSSMAASILRRHGFANVGNVAGGMTGYSAAGYARRCTVCANPHGPKTSMVSKHRDSTNTQKEEQG